MFIKPNDDMMIYIYIKCNLFYVEIQIKNIPELKANNNAYK